MFLDLIAKGFRAINALLLTFPQPWIHRPLKLVYACSSWFYNQGFGRITKKLTIHNFDGKSQLIIDPSRNMGSSIYWTGFHEFHELLFLHKYLKSEMVFLDAGANIGLFTVFAARRVNQGKVIAFEPVPSMIQWLESNLVINHFSNVLVQPLGLSDRSSTLPIYEIESSHEGLSTLYPGQLKQSAVTEIQVKPLDELISDFKINRLDFIKMDIEGGELPALKGSIQTIRKFRPAVMIEINQVTYAAAGYTPAEVYSFFHELGYQANLITKDGLLKPELTHSEFNNVVFLPE